MKNIFIAGFLPAVLLVAFAACQNNSSKHTAAAAPGTQYICLVG